jgi:hypothetical protein
MAVLNLACGGVGGGPWQPFTATVFTGAASSSCAALHSLIVGFDLGICFSVNRFLEEGK